MRKLLFSICWLMSYVAVAQEQMTNFENTLSESPNQVQKLDTINGKLLFFINRPEISGRNLWVTDGTPEHTRLITDGAGVSPELSEGSLRQYGYLYLRREFVYRTKGDSLERVIRDTDSMEGFYSFNNKILLFYRSNKVMNGENVITSQFQWLNADNTRTLWEENVLAYKMIGATLHYIRFNYQTRLHELCKLDKDGVLKKNIIATPDASTVQSFEYLYNNGMEYYFFDCERGRKMLAKPEHTREDLQFTDWGGNSFLPFIVKDSAQNAYFLKHYGAMTLYALTKDNQLSPEWEVPVSSIYLSNTDIYGNSIRYRHFMVAGDKLIFNSTSGGEGINGYFLNVFDLKTGVNKKSRNLIEHFRWTYYDLKISVIDTNTYVLDNTVGRKYTYSFLKDTITNISSYPFEYDIIKDSLVTVNKHSLVLSGNIYMLKGSTKKPLLPTRFYYSYDPGLSFSYRIMNDRIFYWKHNPILGAMQLWISEGKKNDLKLLMQAKEGFNYAGNDIIAQNGKLYFSTYNAKNGISVYITDGTEAGTRKIFENSSANFTSVNQVRVNKKQIVLLLNNITDRQARVVMIEDDKGYQLNFPILNYYDIFVSDNRAFVEITNNNSNDLYELNTTGLKLIERRINNIYFYQDRVFFQKIISNEDNPLAVYTLDDSDIPVRFLPENTSGLSVHGNVMIYTRNIGTESVFTALNLATNQSIVKHAKGHTNNFGWYFNETIVMSNLLKLSYIRNNRYKEYEIGFRAENGIAAFNKGMLLIGTRDLAYYDLEEEKATRILTQQDFVSGHIYNYVGQDRDFLLVELKDDKGNISWAYWSVTGKKLIYLKDHISYFAKVSKSGGISYSIWEGRYTYWHYKDGLLTEKYVVPNFEERSLFQENGDFYTTITNDSTGYEIYHLGPDSLMGYQEVVDGREGIEMRNVFRYNNEIYVYGFTYTYGMQVWKMVTPKAVTNTDTVINGTEMTAEPYTVFPNPTQDWLYIKSEKRLPYKLINTRGQAVMHGNSDPQQGINIKQVPQGIYLIQVFDGGRIYVSKVVKE